MQTSEDRRRFAMVMIIMAVAMLAYSWYAQKTYRPPEEKAVEEVVEGDDGGSGREKPPPAGGEGEKPAQPPAGQVGGAKEPVRKLTIKTAEMEVRLSSMGAGIERLALIHHHPSAEEKDKPLVLLDRDMLLAGLSRAEIAAGGLPRRRSMVLAGFREGLDFEDWNWKLDESKGKHPEVIEVGDDYRVAFLARRGDLEVRKTYTFHGTGFDTGLEVAVTNHAAEARRVEYKVIGAAGLVLDEPASRFTAISALLAGRDSPFFDLEMKSVTAKAAPGYAKKKRDKLENSKAFTEWAALRGRYFAAVLAPRRPGRVISAFAAPLDPDEGADERKNLSVGLKVQDFELKPGERAVHGFFLRVGPQKYSELQRYTYDCKDEKGTAVTVNRGMDRSVDFSWDWCRPLSLVVLWLINQCHRFLPNYGWSIVLVTMIVRLSMHPLTRKSQTSMFKMQEDMGRIKPKLDAIQKQYKNEPDKLRQAQMRLYKEEGVNPMGFAGGCLPMLLQMPVFIALYGAIRGAFVFRQAGFLWIDDLSRPDALLELPFWPHQLNALPFVFAGLMLAQSFAQPKPPDESQRQQQMIMRYMMPGMLFFIFYHMPSAFVLYFAASSIFGFAESKLIKHRMAKAKAARAAAEGGAVGASSAARRPEAGGAPPPDPGAFWQSEGQKKRKKKGRK